MAEISNNPGKKAQKSKKPLIVFIAVFLAAAILITGFVFPGFFRSKKPAVSALVNAVEVTVPNPTGPEALVGMACNVALQYYSEARMYLERLGTYDTANADGKELKALLDDTVTAFENAEKISECLGRAVDKWMEAEDVREAPTYKVLNEAKAPQQGSLFIRAFAKEPSESEKWAQEIVGAFDKAKNGQKIKAVAELLGTDAKHAYAELKIAQAVLEGAEYSEIAAKADTCVKVAKTLKTAGTVAGLVIAAAPVATGAVATMATGEMLATGGGIVMGAVNSGLEITSTGAMFYYGTDDNTVTKTADAVADSDFMKTANLVVGLAGVGYNISGQIKDMNKLMDNADKADEMYQLFTSLSVKNGKEASNLFGILSFGLGNFDPESNTICSFSPGITPDGLKVTVKDTAIGASEEQQNAMKEVLENAGCSPEAAGSAVAAAAEAIASGAAPETASPAADAPLPEELVTKTLEDNGFIAPGSTFFNLDDFISGLDVFMESVAAFKAGAEASSEKQTEGTEKTASDAKWVDPYEHFGVNDIVALYPLLAEAKPLKLEVTPICFDNNDRELIEFSNTGSFIIDMTKDAVTTYETSFVNGFYRYDLKITLTGVPASSDLLQIRSDCDCYRAASGEFDEHRENEDCIIFNRSLDPHAPFADKAISFDNYSTATIAFRIDKALIAE